VTVTTSGFLDHPALIQPVPVKGLTVDEIADRLKDMRKSTNTARIGVSVRDYVSHRIIVSGLVKDPGMKILRREAIPLSVVIADAQRLPEAEIVKVVRNETNEVFTVELANDSELGLLIRPGDVITLEIAPRQFFYVGGEVKSPGEKVFRRGLTLTQAILSAGGLEGKANEIRLGRDDGRGFVVMTRYKLKDIESGKQPDPLIQPGDRITVVK
jgi:protein involved in polysaccharide export with SLBB domain